MRANDPAAVSDELANRMRENEQQGADELRALLIETETYLRRFVSYPEEAAIVAHALWIGHAHCIDAAESTPRLAFLSVEPASGKTRALEVTETLVPRPCETVNATAAFIFRRVASTDGKPTMIFDEADTVFGPAAKLHEDIRGILNAGHRRGAKAGRCVVRGKVIETEELEAFSAVALAGLGNLPDTILSRSIIVRMRRRAPGEEVEPYRRRLHAPEGEDIARRWAPLAERIIPALRGIFPEMPAGVADRDADVWEPLLAIADFAGGEWPERARVAAVALVAAAKGGTPSLGIRLLADLRTVFAEAGAEAMPTREVLAALIALEESPWGDMRGATLDSRKLSRMLSQYGVRPRTIRIGGETPKGYTAADLRDPWARYLPPLSTVATADDNPLQSSREEIDEEGDMSLFPIDAATSATPATDDHWAAYQRIRAGE